MPDIENLLNIEDEVTQVLSDLGVNEKLNEMDDFMNQNDLKVQITNENAVVTGLVTYTCTVKDKNNTALANKVVEWYKETTLIGIDATDSNGVSTFSHRVTEADIYDVHAIVRGTHAGDDIRMFVKEKRNLLPTNIWSCGESSELGFNDNSPSTDISINKSNEWSNIGNYSAKCDILNTGAYVGYKITDIQELAGKTIQFSAYINTPVKLKISIYQLVNGSYSETAVTVPALTNSENSVSVTLNENAERILLRICHNEQTLTEQISYYIDNWCLEEV